MSAHESMEHAEHAEHASGSNKNIALLIAVIALFLGAVGDAGQGRPDRIHQQERRGFEPVGVLSGQEHSPHRGSVGVGASQIEPRRHGRRCRQGGAAKADRRLAEDRGALPLEPETGEGSEQLSERAKHAEHERDLAMAKYHHFEVASAAFQIGIVLASATIITGMIALAWISGLLALTGLVFTAIGLFAPHAVHLM